MFAVSALFAGNYFKNDQIIEAEPLFEEIIFLIDAKDEKEAQKRCEIRSKEEESEYQSGQDEKLVWSFKQVLHITDLETGVNIDGADVFSRFLNPKQAAALMENTLA